MDESVEEIYYERNRNVTLNTVKYYYKNYKKKLTEQTRDKYKKLFDEDKNKKREYGKNRCHSMSKEKKQKLKKYQKKLPWGQKVSIKQLIYFMDLIVYAMI